jgi:PAS domain S-box-containing protein
MDAESVDHARSRGKRSLRHVAPAGPDGPVTYGTLKKLVEKHSEGLVIFDLEGSFVQFNRALVEIFGHTEEGLRKKEWLNLISAGEWQDKPARLAGTLSTLDPHFFLDKELEFLNGKGKSTVVSISGGLLEESPSGNHILFASFRDITAERKRMEDLTEIARRLASYASELEKELRSKKKELESSKKDMEEQSKKSGKMRDGVQHLLTSIQDQRTDLERRITSNCSLTIGPVIEQLKKSSASDCDRLLLDVLWYNIIHITSYFGLSLARQEHRLTPRELQICQMLRAGHDTRQIARALNLSRQTVIAHRKNIRNKLGIKGTNHNLARYLTEVL